MDQDLRRKANLCLENNWEKYEAYNEILETSFRREATFKGQSNYESLEPAEVFVKFFTEELLESIVEYTNKAESLGQGLQWKEFNKDELKAFLGIIIMMGIVKLPNCRWHWSNSERFGSSPIIRKSLSMSRFNAINKWICLYDKTNFDGQDKLYKVRKLSDSVLEACQRNFGYEQELSIDESMISFKGRNKMKQYMPRKPTKWGFKVFVLAGAKTGYVYRCKIFTGLKEFSPERVCCDLLEGMSNKHVFMDNWYISIPVVERLLTQGIHTTGTIKKERKHLPAKFKEQTENMKFGEVKFWNKGDITLCAWKDKRLVTSISSYYGNELYKKKKANSSKVIPYMINEYNYYMKGVDLFDQMMGYYKYPHKTLKWWKTCFFYFLEVALHNSRVIYNKNKTTQMEYLEFRIQVAESLTQANILKRQARKTPLPRKFERKESKSVPRGRCFVCRRYSATRQCLCCERIFHLKCLPNH